jgi:ubiquinone/menaquinone biosynthesis C-methylase UbiE
VRSIAGLDRSGLSVKCATKRNKERVAAGKAEFVQGDACALPWEDNRFSAVTSMGSFIALPKPLQALKEMHRVLTDGGRAVIVFDWNAEDGMDHAKYVKKYGMTMYTENEVRALMNDAGFSSISISYAKGFMMPKIMIARGTKQQ